MSSDYENSDNEYFEDDDEIMDEDDGESCALRASRDSMRACADQAQGPHPTWRSTRLTMTISWLGARG